MSEEKPPEPTSVPQQPDEKKSGSNGWVIARLLGLAGLIFLFAGRFEGTAQYGLWFLAFGVIGIVVVLITTPGYKPREIPSQGWLLALLLGFAGLIFLGFLVSGAVSVEDAVFLVIIRVIWGVVVLVTTPGWQMFLISVLAIGVIWAKRKRRKMGYKQPIAPQALPQTLSEESSNQESEPSELPSSLQQPKKEEGLSIRGILLILGVLGLVSFIIICYAIKVVWTGFSNSGL